METQTEIIKQYANSNKVKCLYCNKKIEKGLMSWCSFKCEYEFKKKYKLKIQKQISNKVFEMIKEVLKE